MEKIIAAKLVVNMKIAVSHWGFLSKYQLNKATLNKAYSQREFYDSVLNQVKLKNYSCKATIESFKIIVNNLFDLKLEDDFIKKAYDYTLSLSFPEAVDPSYKVYPSLCFELYLKTLKVINDHQKHSDDLSFMSIYPFELLSEKEIKAIENPEEYKMFKNAFETQYIYTMMKLNYEVEGHSTIEHILGVHFLATYIARQLKEKGVSIDLGRVSGAAAGHDIGKFGCRPEDKHKIAYYHYYYTYHWFNTLGIDYIKQVAVNHSTWDLEIESLSIESLVLIFSDFCVKRSRKTKGLFAMKFLDVETSFHVILNKLDQVDETKKKRYEKVYLKLKNFNDYLLSQGLSVTVNNYDGQENFLARESQARKISEKDLVLEGQDLVDNLKFKAIESSIQMMYLLRDNKALTTLLQRAGSQDDPQKFRRYLFIFEAYSTYLTPHQKLITLEFLSRYVMHSEEDIRKSVGLLMGQLLATYDENYAKELPESAEIKYTIDRKLTQFNKMINNFLKGEVFLTPLKREKQMMTYLYFIQALYEKVDEPFKQPATAILLSYLEKETDDFSKEFLIQVIAFIPRALIDEASLEKITNYLISQLNRRNTFKILSLKSLNELRDHESFKKIILPYKTVLKDVYNQTNYVAEIYLIEALFKYMCIDFESSYKENRATLFLENLKSDTHKVRKMTHVAILLKRSFNQELEERFYTAMHYCNLLKVSAYEEVRHSAGNALVKLFFLLSSPHKNDIVVELLRALEIEGFAFTKYMPKYLGQLIVALDDEEYNEILTDIAFKIDNGQTNLQVLLLETLKTMIQSHYDHGDTEKTQRLIAVIFKGLYSNASLTRQVAFEVLCKDILGHCKIDLSNRYQIFIWLYKKINNFVEDFNRFYKTELLEYAVGLHHIYNFITDYTFSYKDMVFPKPREVVLYTGTFDPFSLGQKEVCLDLASLGYDVYVEISEFQWRRRTQPSLLRRLMVEMTIADAFNVYTWSQKQPLNMKALDMIKLKKQLKNRKLSVAIGEETLLSAAVYDEENDEIYKLPHIIYKRESVVENSVDLSVIEEKKKRFKEKVVNRSLKPLYESINVNKIRRNIDEEWQTFYLLDDLAGQLIEKKRLYKNEPQFKETLNSMPIVLSQKLNVNSKDIIQRLTDFKSWSSLKMKLLSDTSYNFLTIDHEITHETIAYAVYEVKNQANAVKELSEIKEGIHQSLVVLDLGIKKVEDPDNLEQILITELLTTAIASGSTMAFVSSKDLENEFYGVLIRSGFTKDTWDDKTEGFKCDMTSPVILNLDGISKMKEVFRKEQAVVNQIKWARNNLQEAIVKMYPNTLLISFDRGMMYNHLIKKITSKNQVPIHESHVLGPYVCVPYGDIFKRWLLPNTITKAFHAERYYPRNLDLFEVDAYPGYLSLKNQGRVLENFKRQIILVDDLLDSGNRLIAFETVLNALEISIDSVYTGVLTTRGKECFRDRGFTVEGAYEFPEIKAWFNEGDLYPFIGGNGIKSDDHRLSEVMFSINFILPFVYPEFMKAIKREFLYEFSKVCLENTQNILIALEEVYLSKKGKHLTIDALSEVMIIPRWPDVGQGVKYDPHEKPSTFIKNQLERLNRLKPGFVALE